MVSVLNYQFVENRFIVRFFGLHLVGQWYNLLNTVKTPLNKILKKIGIYDYFEYVAGSDTFDYCKPDPRHLTSVVEILDGDIKKSIMIGDSETDANAAKAAEIPIILLEDGYTEKNKDEIYHNHLIKDFIGIEKIISEYL